MPTHGTSWLADEELPTKEEYINGPNLMSASRLADEELLKKKNTSMNSDLFAVLAQKIYMRHAQLLFTTVHETM
uniref:Uncharacterized protein n=1 Tax=Oryza sativa subsp. japonica TaxID=39947 RepID=Q8H5C0_ORYSJ|nr:unknown protein [Oryza sativa Japonica Group]BAD30679.1 unknown protein [Oryza sativa Japonica Group]